SAAAVVCGGHTKAAIDGSGSIKGVSGISLETLTRNTATAAAAGLAAGAGAVDAGGGVVHNEGPTATIIYQGVSIVKLNKPAVDISLKSSVNTDADVFTVGAAGGAVAVGASVALIQLSPTVRTHIGAVPGTAAANDGNKGHIQ